MARLAGPFFYKHASIHRVIHKGWSLFQSLNKPLVYIAFMKSAPSARSLHSGQFFRSAALLCTLLSQSLFAGQKVFDFNSNCQQAYHEIISLKLEHGELILEEEKKKDPNNLVPYFLENYLDFFILYFTEDPTEFRRR